MPNKLNKRRVFLKKSGGLLGASLLFPYKNIAQSSSPNTDPSTVPGKLPSELGTRSKHEDIKRYVRSKELSSWSYTPLEKEKGIITPSDLHFERHHGGIPEINPLEYKLIVHGMVDKPLKFTLDDLKRFPSISRLCFIECSGNGYQNYFYDDLPKKNVRVGELDGLISTSEWTGVPLSLILKEAGINTKAKWLLAEGQDAAKMTRSIPVDKAMDDALLVFAQNGEALRPGMGYPLRLLLPGWEGNTQIKWLRRIEVSDTPFMTREETSKYSDATIDGKARLFSFTMEVKSVITSPTFPQLMKKGYQEISGMAWSGLGKINKVEVSTNGGKYWFPARLQQPNLSKCPVRFNYQWEWKGGVNYMMSRATDEFGNIQPMPLELKKVRGDGFFYHNNSIRPWKVNTDGSIHFAIDEFI